MGLGAGLAAVLGLLAVGAIVGGILVANNRQRAADVAEPTATPSPTRTHTPTPGPPTATTAPPTDTSVPATETLSPAEREQELLSTLDYREGNGEVILAHRVETPPQIDGRLDEWTGRRYDVAYRVHDPEGAWSGRSDLYGRFRVGWDDDNLYLAVEVTDDAHVQNQSGATLYKGDDVEIQIDRDLSGDFHDSSLSDDDGQVGLSPGDFGSRGPEAYIWRPPSREQPGTMISIAAQPTAGAYALEAAMPWWTLGDRPSIETPVGFCLSLGDNDVLNASEQQKMLSTAPARKWGDPTTWGTLILVDWR